MQEVLSVLKSYSKQKTKLPEEKGKMVINERLCGVLKKYKPGQQMLARLKNAFSR